MLTKHYKTKDSDEENSNHKHNYSQVFANNQSDDETYPLTVYEISDSQRSDPKWKKFFKKMIQKEKSLSDHQQDRSADVYPVKTLDTSSIMNQDITIVTPLLATSWYLQT